MAMKKDTNYQTGETESVFEEGARKDLKPGALEFLALIWSRKDTMNDPPRN